LPHATQQFRFSSGSDRYDLAASQGLDIANWGPAKESPVLPIELARAFVADLERRTCRILFTREHALPRGMQAKLLLKLQRTHRRKGAKMLVQRRSTHARNRPQVLYTQRLLVVGTQPGNRFRRPVALGLERGNRAKACSLISLQQAINDLALNEFAKE
jgi:hypothetical protein